MNRLVVAFAALGFAYSGGSLASAATLVNGSFDGTVSHNATPAGWHDTYGTPDINDVNNNVGGLVDFFAPPSGPSPDGGTFVGLVRDGGYVEEIEQTVTDFVAGATYEIAWYAGNFGADSPPGYDAASGFEILIDGVVIGVGPVLSLGPDWFAQSIFFTATAATHTIGFRPSGDLSYMSLDGVTLSEIPVPGALLLFGTGLVGFAARRRLKRG